MEKWPNDTELLLKRAWILATTPLAELRNGGEAVRLARAAFAGERNEDAGRLEVLAAAYAARGEFSSAMDAAERARRIAEQTGAKSLAHRIGLQLDFYRRGQPLVVSVPRSPPGSED